LFNSYSEAGRVVNLPGKVRRYANNRKLPRNSATGLGSNGT
jgi:hypothetical protein